MSFLVLGNLRIRPVFPNIRFKIRKILQQRAIGYISFGWKLAQFNKPHAFGVNRVWED